MPGQAPHVDSDTTAPAAMRSATSPSRAIVSRICSLAGKSTNDTSAWTRRPRRTSATTDMSSHEPLVQDPTRTCSIGVPSTSPTGTT